MLLFDCRYPPLFGASAAALIYPFLLLLLLCSCVSRHCSIYQECHLVLYDNNIWSSLFSDVVRVDTYIPKDLDFSISVTGSAICWYRCSESGRPYLSHRLQWTIPATLSCLFLYSSCDSLLRSLDSSLSLHILHLTSPSCLSVRTFSDDCTMFARALYVLRLF